MTINISFQPHEFAHLESAKEIRNLLRTTYQETLRIIGQCDVGKVSLHDLAGSRLSSFNNAQTRINTLRAIGGVALAYESLYPLESFKGSLEISIASDAMGVLADYITTQIPKDYNNRLLTFTLVGRQLVQLTSTNSQFLANLKVECKKYTATIVNER